MISEMSGKYLSKFLNKFNEQFFHPKLISLNFCLTVYFSTALGKRITLLGVDRNLVLRIIQVFFYITILGFFIKARCL